jgi:hypothetical protein
MIINVKSREEALDWVSLARHGQGRESVVEVRQLFGADDFADQLTPESREREDQMRAELAERGMK